MGDAYCWLSSVQKQKRRQCQQLHMLVRFKFYVVKMVSLAVEVLPVHIGLYLGHTFRGITGYEPFIGLVPAGNVETTPDLPSVPMANAQAPPGKAQGMDGHQFVQWLQYKRVT